MTNQSTAVTYFIVAVVGSYCLGEYQFGAGQTLKFPAATYLIITLYGILGVLRWVTDDDSNIKDAHDFTGILIPVIAMPCITTEVWLKHAFLTKEYAMAHTAVGVIPTALYIVGSESRNELMKLIHLTASINIISLGGVGFMHENYFAVYAAIAYGITHFSVTIDIDMPKEQFRNLCLALFAFLSKLAIQ